MISYFQEPFTKDEQATLLQYVSNVDEPVFVLTHLPQATAAALFARYSRSPKSLRRLLLDEFLTDADRIQDSDASDAVGMERATDLFKRVLSDYGDDSVAQLAMVQIACEQVSQLLAKQLEWGRLAAYLEQSTRYIPYTDKPNGFFRYVRDEAVISSPVGAQYVAAMDGLFDTYCAILPELRSHLEQVIPLQGDGKAMSIAIRALALDIARALLPAGTVSNVGICATPQALEQMVYRLRAHTLPEAKFYGERIAASLTSTIPSFVSRINRPERGGVWQEYLADRDAAVREVARTFDVPQERSTEGPSIRLVEWDQDGEARVLAGALYSATTRSFGDLLEELKTLDSGKISELFRTVTGERLNRRHRPGRGFEYTAYTFDCISDFGAFRDLQRHRMLTIQWQALTPMYGYDVPHEVKEIGKEDVWRSAVGRAEEAFEALVRHGLPEQAQYCVTLGHKMRYSIKLNAREALHMIELRTSPQGHASYRRICQAMYEEIEHTAHHKNIAQAMKFVGMDDVYLPRYHEAMRGGHDDAAVPVGEKE
ncbi:MAG: FAD-dependent thymidylate synthase [Candidatus Dormibacteria bacterium]